MVKLDFDTVGEHLGVALEALGKALQKQGPISEIGQFTLVHLEEMHQIDDHLELALRSSVKLEEQEVALGNRVVTLPNIPIDRLQVRIKLLPTVDKENTVTLFRTEER